MVDITGGKRGYKSAFTLIELLVVIAIIAILAAILFPVFAQARAAARQATSLSNEKQITLGILMYLQDYDETFPMDLHTTRTGPWCLGGGSPCNPICLVSTWPYDIQPYIKSDIIFQDPLAGFGLDPGFFSGNLGDFFWTGEGQYGYNYTALSPVEPAAYNGPAPWVRTPATMASIARPADLILLAGKAALQEEGWWWQGPGTVYSYNTVEPPDCWDIAPACFDNWGQGNGSWGDFIVSSCPQCPLTAQAGRYTGTVALRKGNMGIFAFTDGHVKTITPAAAAVGTNWSPNTIGANIHIIDPTVYKWQTNP